MPTTFANTIDGNLLYAARAEADQDGLNLKQYYAKVADLASIAFSGSYRDLENAPVIPSKTSELTNDSGFITASQVPAQVNADWDATSGYAQILNKPELSNYALLSSLALVATSGSYLDLSDRPMISNVPTVTDSDDGKVLKASYTGGIGSYSWEPASSITQVQANWIETDPTDPAYIKNKPTIPVVPTTDQTYDSSSSNPQSGTAVAEAIAGVNQVPTASLGDSGKVLTVNSSGNPEWQTSGGGGGGESINAINPIYKNGSDVGLKLLGSGSGLEVLQQERESASATWVHNQGIGTDYFIMSLSDISGYTTSDARLVATDFYPQYFTPSSGYYKIFLVQGINPANIDSSTPYAYSASDWQEGIYLDSILLEGGSLSFFEYNGFSFDSEFMVFFVDSYYGGDASGLIGSSDLLTWSSTDASLKWVLENVYTDYGLKALVDQGYDPSSPNAQSGVAVKAAISGKQDILSAGNMISIVNSEVGVNTTAGITDVQIVNALPASPDPTVLYLIPEV